MKAVKIVGAGLAGSLLAVLLKRRGLEVEIFEKRTDPRKVSKDAGRSINLIITSRGIHGLERAGLAEKALSLSVPVYGRMIHGLDSSTVYQPYGRKEDCNYSISRSELNHFLIDAAEAAGVKFYFDHTLDQLDLEAKKATFSGAQGSRTVHYDLLLGADGAGSRVRKTLCEKIPEEFKESIEWLEADYKEMFLPSAANGSPALQKDALHIWPRGSVMMMALANRDTSFTVTLYMPKNNRPVAFDQIKTEADLEKLFQEKFPDAVPLMPERAKDFFHNPQGALGTVRLNKWIYKDSLALLGDAAHAVVPFFGQGMNSSFEDCTAFDDLLQKGLSGSELLDEYQNQRILNGRAIADMAIENWYEMADRVGDSKFQLRKKVESLIEARYPDQYRSRYGMICYTLVPYSEAKRLGQLQSAFLDELCSKIDSPDQVNWAKVEAALPGLRV